MSFGMDGEESIRVWFQVNAYCCIVLPDAQSYGGTYSLHRIDTVTTIDNAGLRLTMDGGRLALEFSGLVKIRHDDKDLVLGPFTKVTLTGLTPRGKTVRTFLAGEVRFRPIQVY